ncbi:hypothetical protein [Rhizobium mongolense]|nr:hypothetical protein [Rhizobium mongolense]
MSGFYELWSRLEETDLLDDVRWTFYSGRPQGGRNTLNESVPKDDFLAFLCAVTEWEFKVCYHTVAEAIEIAHDAFRIVYRYKQWQDATEDLSDPDAWYWSYVVDRIDGDEKMLRQYLVTQKLARQ